jgi:hypothetical protein
MSFSAITLCVASQRVLIVVVVVVVIYLFRYRLSPETFGYTVVRQPFQTEDFKPKTYVSVNFGAYLEKIKIRTITVHCTEKIHCAVNIKVGPLVTEYFFETYRESAHFVKHSALLQGFAGCNT